MAEVDKRPYRGAAAVATEGGRVYGIKTTPQIRGIHLNRPAVKGKVFRQRCSGISSGVVVYLGGGILQAGIGRVII